MCDFCHVSQNQSVSQTKLYDTRYMNTDTLIYIYEVFTVYRLAPLRLSQNFHAT